MTSTTLTPKTLRHTAPLPAQPQARLLAFDVGGEVRLFELRAELVRIGRGHAADVCLDDGTVSRRHALLLTRPNGTVEVIDEHSAAGTFVCGERVQRQVLHHGDVLRIGQTEVAFIDTSRRRVEEGARLL
jgi:pSer/pThr/pTyr-binding forkhead associated (FHA) protein